MLRQVSFAVQRGELMALVGESGCGKTLTALAILGLAPRAANVRGDISLAGVGDLQALGERARRRIRGRRVAMIFQEPMSALNPVLSLGRQIGENLRRERRLSRREVRRESRRLLELVAMPDADRRLRCYPHQLSGGQLQRAMIAMALASEPELLLADEPTTALDVTVQAQVIELLLSLRRRLGLTVLLITHDLGVVAQSCDRVVVMYAGQVVEEAPVGELFEQPAHPYTRALLASVPRLDGSRSKAEGIAGRVPVPGDLPSGCVFHPRCDSVIESCRASAPELVVIGSGNDTENGHSSRCFLSKPGAGDPG
ncbi:MAG: ABC transporter ATP-binding protein [bacterium]|nr:ABC transporter ATP-binding protein [bacterium]